MWRGPAGSVVKTARDATESLGVRIGGMAVLHCPHGYHHTGTKKKDKLSELKKI